MSAQAGYVILAAYLSFFLQQSLHLDLFLGLLITIPLLFLLGIVVEVVFIRPIKRDRTQLSIPITFRYRPGDRRCVGECSSAPPSASWTHGMSPRA